MRKQKEQKKNNFGVDKGTGKTLPAFKQRSPLFLLLIITLLLLACRQEEDRIPAAGIEYPIIVRGIEFQVVEATTESAFVMEDGERLDPTSPEDDVLVVDAEVLAGVVGDVQAWRVSVSEADGGKTRFLSFALTTDYENEQPDRVRWVFVVPRAWESMYLNLPDAQRIVLDPLLE